MQILYIEVIVMEFKLFGSNPEEREILFKEGLFKGETRNDKRRK